MQQTEAHKMICISAKIKCCELRSEMILQIETFMKIFGGILLIFY